MLKREVNFYIAALLITVVGAAASVAIIRTVEHADTFVYGDAYFAPVGDGIKDVP